jgi:hypothetical protein
MQLQGPIKNGCNPDYPNCEHNFPETALRPFCCNEEDGVSLLSDIASVASFFQDNGKQLQCCVVNLVCVSQCNVAEEEKRTGKYCGSVGGKCACTYWGRCAAVLCWADCFF